MKLYFVRHATASSKATWAHDDELRPLTRTGRQRFAALVAALVGADALKPDVIVTSPLVRACQTAELLRDGIACDAVVTQDSRLGPDFDLEALSAILAEHADARCLAIVGHNPSFAAVLSAITGGCDLEMRKGAIALVDVEDPAVASGRLLWLAPPSLFDGAASR